MTARILILANSPALHDDIRNRIADGFPIIEAIDNAHEAIDITLSGRIELIIIGHDPKDMNAYELCRRIKTYKECTHLPVIVYVDQAQDQDFSDAIAANANDIISASTSDKLIASRLRNQLRAKRLHDELLLRQSTALDMGIEPPRLPIQSDHAVLVIGNQLSDDAIARDGYVLHYLGPDQADAALADTMLRKLDDEGFAAVIITDQGDRPHAQELIAQIRALWEHRDTVILIIASSYDAAQLHSVLDAGADEIVGTEATPLEIQMRLGAQLNRRHYTMALRENLEQQLRLSVIDPLTELHNRRYFEFYFPKIRAQAQRSQSPVAVMALDIDRFKSLNDSYGHEFGDFVLSEFARRLRENMRAADLVARFGGEEFMIVTPGADATQAQSIAERIRRLMQDEPFIASDGEEITVTVSIGITMLRGDEKSIEAVIRRADRALYDAKEGGRNQVRFAAVA